MAELPADFDLKLMPDWLKEPASKNPYADYEGVDDQSRGRGRDSWGGGQGGGDRRGRPGGPGGPGGQRKPGGGPRDNRDNRGRGDAGRKDRPAGSAPRPGEARRPDQAGARPQGGAPQGGAHPQGGARTDDRRRDGRQGDQRRTDQRDTQPQVQPANVTIEFFPDEGCSVSIAKQIKSTHRAYSLFDLARMFLARPERHRVKITTKSVAEPLYQVGDDGPVWFDRDSAERAAFPMLRQKFYVEVSEQREAPKGNFTNVARCRANGVLLGPTNYHGYQPALRRLFEERFSRRMSFAEFQREIETVNDPAVIEQWKQQASSSTVYRLKPAESAKPEPAEPAKEDQPPAAETAPAAGEPVEGATVAEAPEAQAPTEPVAGENAPETSAAEPQQATPQAYEGPVFNNLGEVEQHFRETFLPSLLRQASSFHLSGVSSRALTDRSIAAAVRIAWEQERGFPGQMMHQLRQHFSRAGLHVFKHRKRMQFVSLIRPSPMEGGSLSPSVAQIIKIVQESHNCNRATLAATILGTDEAAIDPAKRTTLATDLRWLIETGRVIEFSDGRLEMPVTPAKPEPAAAKPEAPAAEKSPEPQAVAEAPANEAASLRAVEVAEPLTEAAEPVAKVSEPTVAAEAPVAEKTPEAEPITEPALEPVAQVSADEPEASASVIIEPAELAAEPTEHATETPEQAVEQTPTAELELPAAQPVIPVTHPPQVEEAHAIHNS